METLAEAVARECASCDAICTGWVGDGAFIVQTRVEQSRRKVGDWVFIEPHPVKAAAWHEASETVARLKTLFPGIDGLLVGYVFRPGESFIEVFRR